MDPKRLREQTRAEHEATEAAVPLMTPGLTVEQYRKVLQVLLPVVASWEDWAAAKAPEALQTLVQERRRSHLLKQDLGSLGAGAATEMLPQPTPDWGATVAGGERKPAEVASVSPEFQAAFLGAMYVMEGSTLGGRFIARHVETALGLTPGEGNAYFEGHGQHTGRLWREVTTEIAAVPEELSPVVIEAARRAFAAFGAALKQGLQPQ